MRYKHKMKYGHDLFEAVILLDRSQRNSHFCGSYKFTNISYSVLPCIYNIIQREMIHGFPGVKVICVMFKECNQDCFERRFFKFL